MNHRIKHLVSYSHKTKAPWVAQALQSTISITRANDIELSLNNIPKLLFPSTERDLANEMKFSLKTPSVLLTETLDKQPHILDNDIEDVEEAVDPWSLFQNVLNSLDGSVCDISKQTYTKLVQSQLENVGSPQVCADRMQIILAHRIANLGRNVSKDEWSVIVAAMHKFGYFAPGLDFDQKVTGIAPLVNEQFYSSVLDSCCNYIKHMPLAVWAASKLRVSIKSSFGDVCSTAHLESSSVESIVGACFRMQNYLKALGFYYECPNYTQCMATNALRALGAHEHVGDPIEFNRYRPFMSARYIFAQASLKFEGKLDINLVEAFFEALLAHCAGYATTTYWLQRVERMGIQPTLKIYATIISRYVYTRQEPEAFKFVELARKLDPENYKDIIFDSIARSYIMRKDYKAANFFLLNWIRSNTSARKIPVETFRFVLQHLSELPRRPTWAFKFYTHYKRAEYPLDVEFDSRIIQLYNDHSAFSERRINRKLSNYAHRWQHDIENYHVYLKEREMYKQHIEE